jgi:hypothetical protein
MTNEACSQEVGFGTRGGVGARRAAESGVDRGGRPRMTAAELWDVMRPREHGSWSLALEPVALGLIAAPSIGGAWLALAVVAGFFARRPLRISVTETREERRAVARAALALCGGVALAAVGAACGWSGWGWLAALLPVLAGGAIFLCHDLRNDGRDVVAELAGAMAFACLPAAFAVLAGWNAGGAAALAGVMVARAVPTVVLVRALVRGRKNGETKFGIPLGASGVACLGLGGLALAGVVPAIVAIGGALLFARVFVYRGQRHLAARTIGVVEAVLGVVFVVGVGIGWR